MPRRAAALSACLAFPLMMIAPASFAAGGPGIITVPATSLGPGRMEVSYGLDYSVKNGVDAGDLRKLTRVLPLSVRFGVSRGVDVIVGWRGGLIARSADGAKYSDWGDPSVSTKITLTDSGRPVAAGLMFGFKIPSTRYLPHRLGSDAADVYIQAVAAQIFSGGEFRVNAGVAISGDPRFAGSQDDMLTGSAILMITPAGPFGVFVELAGFTGPKEDDDKLQCRGGTSFDAGFGTVTLYGNAQLAGNARDFGTAFEATGSWGIGASLTHTVSF